MRKTGNGEAREGQHKAGRKEKETGRKQKGREEKSISLFEGDGGALPEYCSRERCRVEVQDSCHADGR